MGQSNVLATRILLRRFGAVEEIAAAVMFLSSLQAGYVTGQVMAVDGGWQI
jgi:NAD(P)-dependent dehydrogenase (short-subunit alcohol dehydrogenase family)